MTERDRLAAVDPPIDGRRWLHVRRPLSKGLVLGFPAVPAGRFQQLRHGQQES